MAVSDAAENSDTTLRIPDAALPNRSLSGGPNA